MVSYGMVVVICTIVGLFDKSLTLSSPTKLIRKVRKVRTYTLFFRFGR